MNFIHTESTGLKSDAYCLETDHGHSNKANKNDLMVLMSDITVTVATFMILIHSEESTTPLLRIISRPHEETRLVRFS